MKVNYVLLISAIGSLLCYESSSAMNSGFLVQEARSAYADKDYSLAFKLYKQIVATHLDDEANDARLRLGVMYRFGQGTLYNREQAIACLKKVHDESVNQAKQAEACVRLGRIYAQCEPTDLKRARYFLEAAFKQEVSGLYKAFAATKLGLLSTNFQEKLRYFEYAMNQSASNSSREHALVSLADMYYSGKYGVVDHKKSLAYCTELLKGTSSCLITRGKLLLAMLYIKNKGIPVDHEKAKTLLWEVVAEDRFPDLVDFANKKLDQLREST